MISLVIVDRPRPRYKLWLLRAEIDVVCLRADGNYAAHPAVPRYLDLEGGQTVSDPGMSQ
jgi:hypothetical protein